MSSRRRTVSVPKYVGVALAFVLMRLFLVLTLLSLILTAVFDDPRGLWFTLGFVVAGLLTGILFLGNVNSVICPLCRTPVFKGLIGAQKAKSKQRLGFAFKLLRNEPRPNCIHCREPFRWKGH